MRSYLIPTLQLTAFIAFSTLAASTASAQQEAKPTDTSVPSLTRHNPAPVEKSEAAPQLKPVAPEPSVVLQAGTAVSGKAQVLPPAPRIVTRVNGAIAISGANLSGGTYRSQAAGISTALKVNSAYGPRNGRRHTGIDFDGDWGESVGVSMAGTVSFVGVKRGYGNLIIVDHGRGISTYYAHLSSMYVTEGQPVEGGQIIGAIGSTGRSSGPHLHYEVRVNGSPINPSSLISFENGMTLVNGRTLSGEESGDDLAADEAEETTDEARPRRIAQQPVQQPVIKVPGVIYVGESKMSVE